MRRSPPRASMSSSSGRLCHRRRQARAAPGDARHSAEGMGPRRRTCRSRASAADAALDDSRLALQQAQSTVALEQQDVADATAALGGDPEIATDDHPAVRAALAARDVAHAISTRPPSSPLPMASSARSASLNVGQFIATGTTIASLVETGDTWVEANFKETQLSTIAAGMPVEVDGRCLPGRQARGSCRVDRRGHRCAVRADPGAERHRQLGQGDAARARPHRRR